MQPVLDLMPPLILLGFAGAAAWYGYNRMKQDAARIAERARQSEAELRSGAHGTLVRGADGVYRLKRD